MSITHETQFFGDLVSLDCYVQDLLLILEKTESIELGRSSDRLVFDCFPDVTRKSHIVTVLIVLEREFSTLCNRLKLATDQPLKWNDLKGSAIERFSKYCSTVCGIPEPENLSNFQDVKGLIELRNCIVHNDSCIEGFPKATVIKQLASRYDGIDIDNGYITLSHDACIGLTVVAFNFLESWYQSALNHLTTSH